MSGEIVIRIELPDELQPFYPAINEFAQTLIAVIANRGHSGTVKTISHDVVPTPVVEPVMTESVVREKWTPTVPTLPGYYKAGSPWSHQRDKLIISRYEAGVPVNNILPEVITTTPGSMFPVTMAQLRARVAKLGVRRSHKYLSQVGSLAGHQSASLRKADDLTVEELPSPQEIPPDPPPETTPETPPEILPETPPEDPPEPQTNPSTSGIPEDQPEMLSIQSVPEVQPVLPVIPPIKVLPERARALAYPIPLNATREQTAARNGKPYSIAAQPPAAIPVHEPPAVAGVILPPTPPPVPVKSAVALLLEKEAPPDASGYVPMTRDEIIEWGKIYRINYDGTNIKLINRSRLMYRHRPIIQIGP